MRVFLGIEHLFDFPFCRFRPETHFIQRIRGAFKLFSVGILDIGNFLDLDSTVIFCVVYQVLFILLLLLSVSSCEFGFENCAFVYMDGCFDFYFFYIFALVHNSHRVIRISLKLLIATFRRT